MIAKQTLQKLYVADKLSMQQIAISLNCSVHPVHYWMERYEIPRRTVSRAIYQLHNPGGDPFRIIPKRSWTDAD